MAPTLSCGSRLTYMALGLCCWSMVVGTRAPSTKHQVASDCVGGQTRLRPRVRMRARARTHSLGSAPGAGTILYSRRYTATNYSDGWSCVGEQPGWTWGGAVGSKSSNETL